MMGNVRWTEQMHQQASENDLREVVTHIREHVLDRRVLSVLGKCVALLMPPAPTDGSADPFADVRPIIAPMAAQFKPLTPAALLELGTAMLTMAGLDDLATQARADSALLDSALDYETERAQLAALPPAPTDGSVDPYADQRAALQNSMNAASADTTNLVSQRDSYRLANGTPIPGQPIPTTP